MKSTTCAFELKNYAFPKHYKKNKNLWFPILEFSLGIFFWFSPYISPKLNETNAVLISPGSCLCSPLNSLNMFHFYFYTAIKVETRRIEHSSVGNNPIISRKWVLYCLKFSINDDEMIVLNLQRTSLTGLPNTNNSCLIAYTTTNRLSHFIQLEAGVPLSLLNHPKNHLLHPIVPVQSNSKSHNSQNLNLEEFSGIIAFTSRTGTKAFK